ncbi:MAG: YqaE/Pmp3 family membrane protein [Lentisphaeria bacterium]|nr:YqaE/Pmp3 family membrane protein [Lentisphaerota bacterium]MBO5766053.1 YqaE/Pmp3 family membrane protein [Lentisphaeria bacterium]MBR2631937.1 YqaE/Pmp3 family membrane protein [Lentisphaeria bacterium]
MSNRVNVTGGDILGLIVRYLLCLICPPLAVLDKGCGVVILTAVFTLFGWLPGTIYALLICIKDKNYYRK